MSRDLRVRLVQINIFIAIIRQQVCYTDWDQKSLWPVGDIWGQRILYNMHCGPAPKCKYSGGGFMDILEMPLVYILHCPRLYILGDSKVLAMLSLVSRVYWGGCLEMSNCMLLLDCHNLIAYVENRNPPKNSRITAFQWSLSLTYYIQSNPI